MLRTYLYVVLTLVIFVIGWGILAPRLVSSNSDLSVLLGLIVVVIVPTLVTSNYYLWLYGEDHANKKIKDFSDNLWKDK